MEKQMTKLAFNNLRLEEQVNYFNMKLGSGFKIIEICSEVGIAYNTIRDRFGRNDYIYNKYTKRYECSEKIFPLDEETIEKALEKIVTKVFNPKVLTKNEIDCNLEGKVITRSFTLHEDVSKEFKQFCSKTQYRQYDILSTFIRDGIAKYSNV